MDPDDGPVSDGELPLSPSTTLVDNPEHSVFPLFRLPPELRDSIYDHALVSNVAFKLLPKIDEPGERSADPAIPLPPVVHALAPPLASTTQQQPQIATDELSTVPRSPSPALRSSVKYRADINLLLASKAVRHDYESRAKLAMTLVLQDSEKYTFQPVHLPEQVKQVRWAELHIILFCHHCQVHAHSDEQSCQATHEITHHHLWIKHLLTQLPQLRSFTIQAYLCYDPRGTKMSKEERLPCEPIVKQKLSLLYSLPKLHSLTLWKYDFNVKPDLNGPKEVMHEWVSGVEVAAESNTRQCTTSASS